MAEEEAERERERESDFGDKTSSSKPAFPPSSLQ
jgi:hypothetical protein